jgi:hypothetical protein
VKRFLKALKGPKTRGAADASDDGHE